MSTIYSSLKALFSCSAPGKSVTVCHTHSFDTSPHLPLICRSVQCILYVFNGFMFVMDFSFNYRRGDAEDRTCEVTDKATTTGVCGCVWVCMAFYVCHYMCGMVFLCVCVCVCVRACVCVSE